jgi:hypothetical protein
MHAPQNTLRLPIPDDACAKARELLAERVDPDTRLEFMRGDTVCLRGTVRAFAYRRVKHSNEGTPYHGLLTEQERRSAGLPARKNTKPLVG